MSNVILSKFLSTKEKVSHAIKQLYSKDLYLFQIGVHERTIAHKLAEYLQDEFKPFSVDCEYNRDGLDIKALDGLIKVAQSSEEVSECRIFPDIIVHMRGKNSRANNRLVIEIKTSLNASNSVDIQKLCGLTSSLNEFKYCHGLFIRFKTNFTENITIDQLILEMKWYGNGEEIVVDSD